MPPSSNCHSFIPSPYHYLRDLLDGIWPLNLSMASVLNIFFRLFSRIVIVELFTHWLYLVIPASSPICVCGLGELY